MKIDFSAKLKSLEGGDVMIDGSQNPATIKDIAVQALITPDQKLEEKEKFERWVIAKSIVSGDDLKLESVNTIKTCVGKYLNTYVVGSFNDALSEQIDN